MKYPTPIYPGDWPSRVPPDATDDERRLAVFSVQFENGDLPRESVASLLNLCGDLLNRARIANEALAEAGFATMRPDEIADALNLTPEQKQQASDAVRRAFKQAYEYVTREEAKR